MQSAEEPPTLNADDYNSTCNFTNSFAYPLQLVSSNDDIGKWKNSPPQTIAAKSSVTISLQATSWTVTGTKGSFQYRLDAPNFYNTDLIINGFMNCSYYASHGRWAVFSLSGPAATGNASGYYRINGTSPDHNQSAPLVVSCDCTYGQIPPSPNFELYLTQLSTSTDFPIISSDDKTHIGNTIFYKMNEQFLDGKPGEGSLRPLIHEFNRGLQTLNNLQAKIEIIYPNLFYVPWTVEVVADSQIIWLSNDYQLVRSNNPLTVTLGSNLDGNGEPFRLSASLNVRIRLLNTKQVFEFRGPQPYMEIFGVNPWTTRAKSVFAGGIPVVFLRACFRPGFGLHFYKTRKELIVAGAARLFGNWLKYDTTEGRATLVNSNIGENFNMKYFVKKKVSIANCYDYAAIMDLFLDLLALPEQNRWLFMKPFGFINATFLKGFPSQLCNNPYFAGDEKLMKVSTNDKERKMFGNHAFVEWSVDGRDWEMVDLTSGTGPRAPTVDISRSDYVKAAIDKTPTVLYPLYSPPHNRPGRLSDISTNVDWGVRDITAPGPVSSATAGKDDTRRLNHDAILAKTRVDPAPPVKGTTLAWGEIAAFVEVSLPDLKLVDSETSVTENGVSSLYIFECSGEATNQVHLAIKAYKSHDEARYAFAEFLEAFERPLEVLEWTVPTFGQHAILFIDQEKSTENSNLFAWVEGTAFVTVSSENPSATVVQAAQLIQAQTTLRHLELPNFIAKSNLWPWKSPIQPMSKLKKSFH